MWPFFIAATTAAIGIGRLEQRAEQRKIARAVEAGKKFKPTKNIGGTAHFATLTECRKAGLLSGHGIPIGYLNGLQLWLNGDLNNMVSIGGSGSGKTSTLLIPAALLYPHSFAAMDATGELTAVTAKARKKFGRVVQLNYTGYLERELRGVERAVSNLMDVLNPRDKVRFSTQAQHLAASCIRTPSDRDLYWYSTALDLLQVFIMFYAEYGTPEERSLSSIAWMINEDVFDRAKWMYQRAKGNRMLQARLARWASPKADTIKSLGEAIENLRTETSFLLDDGFAETFSGKSTIRFSDCQKRSTSIYTVTPDDGDKRALRAVMGAAQTELLTPGARIPTLMPIDEYYTLRLPDTEDLFAKARKYKLIAWILLQDFEQLRAAHPHTAGSILNSAGCVQVLDATDIQGAEYVSNMCGDLEVLSENRSINWQTDEARGVGFGSGMNQSSKKLMTPANVRELRGDEAVLFIKSLRGIPLKVTRKPYYKTAHGATAQPNPFYCGGK